MRPEHGGGGVDSSVLDANYPPPPTKTTTHWPKAPEGGGGGTWRPRTRRVPSPRWSRDSAGGYSEIGQHDCNALQTKT